MATSTIPGFILLILGIISQGAITGYTFYEYWQIFVTGQEPLIQQIVLGQSVVLLVLAVVKLITNWQAFNALVYILSIINYFLAFI